MGLVYVLPPAQLLEADGVVRLRKPLPALLGVPPDASQDHALQSNRKFTALVGHDHLSTK